MKKIVSIFTLIGMVVVALAFSDYKPVRQIKCNKIPNFKLYNVEILDCYQFDQGLRVFDMTIGDQNIALSVGGHIHIFSFDGEHIAHIFPERLLDIDSNRWVIFDGEHFITKINDYYNPPGMGDPYLDERKFDQNGRFISNLKDSKTHAIENQKWEQVKDHSNKADALEGRYKEIVGQHEKFSEHPLRMDPLGNYTYQRFYDTHETELGLKSKNNVVLAAIRANDYEVTLPSEIYVLKENKFLIIDNFERVYFLKANPAISQ